MDKYLLVGLGNVGEDYSNTRHNAGFWLIEQLISLNKINTKLENKFHAITAQLQIADKVLLLAMPTTFMNNSGLAVRTISDYYKIPLTNLIIAHDEIDIKAGVARLKYDGGSGGNNGIKSLISHLGSTAFKRLRIGVGRPIISSMVNKYVLSAPPKGEREAINSCVDLLIENLPLILDNFEKAQNKINAL